MSEDTPSSGDPNKDLPEGIPAPPPPDPDIKKLDKDEATYGKQDQKKRKKRKQKKERSHPTDAYAPLKKQRGKGCCGCIAGLFIVLILLAVAGVVAIGWFGPGRYVIEGYEIVSFEEPEVTITERPLEPVLYVGSSIRYAVPLTEVPVAIIATEVNVTGEFTENVSLSGAKVIGQAPVRFRKDLEIYAAEFHDKGIVLDGELSGSVMKNIE